MDLHHLLLAGLPAHSALPNTGHSRTRPKAVPCNTAARETDTQQPAFLTEAQNKLVIDHLSPALGRLESALCWSRNSHRRRFAAACIFDRSTGHDRYSPFKSLIEVLLTPDCRSQPDRSTWSACKLRRDCNPSVGSPLQSAAPTRFWRGPCTDGTWRVKRLARIRLARTVIGPQNRPLLQGDERLAPASLFPHPREPK
jgi:hypothetical protein